MKRIAILLLVIACLCITACGGTTSSTKSTANGSTISKSNTNGYDSVEALVDFYVRMNTGQSVSKNEIKKMYPQEVWDNWPNYREHSLDDTYSAAQKGAAETKEKYIQKYGSNYTISYSLDGIRETQSGIYEVIVTVKVTGSLRSQEATNSIFVRKIDNKWFCY